MEHLAGRNQHALISIDFDIQIGPTTVIFAVKKRDGGNWLDQQEREK
jgi:hypothetical protein